MIQLLSAKCSPSCAKKIRNALGGIHVQHFVYSDGKFTSKIWRQTFVKSCSYQEVLIFLPSRLNQSIAMSSPLAVTHPHEFFALSLPI